MKSIRISTLIIKNFKGIQELTINFGEDNTLICGHNGIGKTTIADSFSWLLFNKNTVGCTKFAVRPRDKQRNEIHDIITSVECKFKIVDDCDSTDPDEYTQFTFNVRKEQVEDMTKLERDNIKPETIAKKKHYYFVDNAPYAEKDFDKVLTEYLALDSIFQLISNPLAFFSYDEKNQRKLLFDACGTVANEEIEGWDAVKKHCGAINTPEKVNDSTAAAIAEQRKSMDKIPARIDELSKLIDSSENYEELRNKCLAEYAQIEAQIAVKTNEMTEQIDKSNQDSKAAVMPAVPNMPIIPSKNDIAIAEKFCLQSEDNEKRIIKDIKQLTDSQEFMTCPQCGYDHIPVSDKTEQILSENWRLKAAVVETINYQARIKTEKAKYDDALKLYDIAFEKYQEDMDTYEIAIKDSAKIDTTAIEKLRAEIKLLEDRKNAIIADGQAIKSKIKIVENIAILRQERDSIDEKIQTLSETLEVVKEFITLKANAEMAKINSAFKTVEFTLFEMQTNGEYRSCCKATSGGITYDNLNFAKKVQIGIEVASLFANFYAIKAPIFVDSKESILDMPNTGAQMVFLQVADLPDREFHITDIKLN